MRYPNEELDFIGHPLDSFGEIGWLLTTSGGEPRFDTHVFTTAEVIESFGDKLGSVEESSHDCGITSLRFLARSADGLWLLQCRRCYEWITPREFEPWSPRLVAYVATRPTSLADR